MRGEVRFDHVNFDYHSKPLLNNLSFLAKSGMKVAIVGPSGVGKSTILRLLYRFFDPQTGGIYIDGQDIRNLTLNSLRKIVGVVPQDAVLFNETIFYNIHYGKLSASKEEVIEAAKLAQIHDAILKMPHGYDTIVGERGLKLSGGEKQRISIARTILKDPKIVLCDEATSALDSFTEHQILTSLRNLSKNKTTFMIAHRLSTIVDADLILVLKDGTIVEQGSHISLISNPNSSYAAMWYSQQQQQQGHGQQT